jgi:hypothetical protein
LKELEKTPLLNNTHNAKPRTVCSQEGENDEDITSMDMTLLLSLPTAWPSWPSLLASFPGPASPPDASSSLPFFLLLTDGARLSGSSRPRARARLGLAPESGRGTASPAVQHPGPARQGPCGRPIKPPPRALGSAKPAVVASCFTASPPSPPHLGHRRRRRLATPLLL